MGRKKAVHFAGDALLRERAACGDRVLRIYPHGFQRLRPTTDLVRRVTCERCKRAMRMSTAERDRIAMEKKAAARPRLAALKAKRAESRLAANNAFRLAITMARADAHGALDALLSSAPYPEVPEILALARAAHAKEHGSRGKRLWVFREAGGASDLRGSGFLRYRNVCCRFCCVVLIARGVLGHDYGGRVIDEGAAVWYGSTVDEHTRWCALRWLAGEPLERPVVQP